jgi:glycerol-3-phosphate dehydrogenase
MVERVARDASAGARLDAELPYVMVQVDVAAEEELAATVEDVLGRRVPLLLRARDQGLAAAEPVARRLATRLGWDDARAAAEVEKYRAVVAGTRRFR